MGAREFTLSIDVHFMGHVKTRRFGRLMGDELAFGYLVNLWSWAVDVAPVGDLSKLTIEDIEDGAKYRAMDGRCYQSMVAAGFIDEVNGERRIHDWMEPGHTGYAIAKLRGERDRWRRRHGLQPNSSESTPVEPPGYADFKDDGGNSAGTPREPGGNSVGVHSASRFTVHGSLSEERDPDPGFSLTLLPEVTQTRTPAKSKSRAEFSVDFLKFWAAYPRKVAKGDAAVAFGKTGVAVGLLLGAIDWQRKTPDWLRDGGQFIPHPATWLNRRQWEDEPPDKRNFVPAKTLKIATGVQDWIDQPQEITSEKATGHREIREVHVSNGARVQPGTSGGVGAALLGGAGRLED